MSGWIINEVILKQKQLFVEHGGRKTFNLKAI